VAETAILPVVVDCSKGKIDNEVYIMVLFTLRIFISILEVSSLNCDLWKARSLPNS
jgi:hypothetical protein